MGNSPGARRTITRFEDLDPVLLASVADSFEVVSGQKRLKVNGNIELQGNNPSRFLVTRGSDTTARLEFDFPDVVGGTNEVIYRFGRNTTPLNQRFELYHGATLVHGLNSANNAAYISSLCRQGQTLLVGGTSTPSARASLELQGTDKGLVVNRLTTTQRDAQTGWPAGTIIYNSTDNVLQYRNASAWVNL